MGNGHSRFAPSASERWINCPGSIQLSSKFPDPESTIYAAEGTAAHEVAAKCLREGKQAKVFLGTKQNGFDVNEDMITAVQVYLDLVWDLAKQSTLFMVEHKLDMSWLHKDLFGHSDCIIFHKAVKHLVVIDYKHGKGIAVDPEWNSQAMIYALGALHEAWEQIAKQNKEVKNVLDLCETVDIYIVQPRFYNGEEQVKQWQITTRDLIWWGLHILRPAVLACEVENPRFHAGDHCRFCPAMTGCPEFSKTNLALVKAGFENPSLPSPGILDPHEVSKILKSADLFEAWLKEIRAYAQQQLEEGKEIPGFKLVKKKGNRDWIDETEAGEKLKEVLGDKAYVTKVLSVAKAEAALKKFKNMGGVNLDRLYTKPDNGVTIAPEDDKRQAVLPSVQQHFLTDAEMFQ